MEPFTWRSWLLKSDTAGPVRLLLRGDGWNSEAIEQLTDQELIEVLWLVELTQQTETSW